MALAKSSSDQSPMPSLGSGEMLGTTKSPKSLLQHAAAAEAQPVVALGLLGGVAGGAAAGPEHQSRRARHRPAASPSSASASTACGRGQDEERSAPADDRERPRAMAARIADAWAGFSCFDAVVLVAAAAVLQHRADGRLEGLEIGRAVLPDASAAAAVACLELVERCLRSRPGRPRSPARHRCRRPEPSGK